MNPTAPPSQRRGRLGAALLGAAVLAGVPTLLAWQWLQDARTYPAKPPADELGQTQRTEPATPKDEAQSQTVARPRLARPDGGVSATASNEPEAPSEEAGSDVEEDFDSRSLTSPTFGAEELQSVYGFRTWTASDGAAAEAIYIGRKGPNIVLQDAVGRQYTIPLDRLSDMDQELLRRLWQQ